MQIDSLVKTSFRFATFIAVMACAVHAQTRKTPVEARESVAKRYFGNDAPWYLENIPFLEIDDPAIEQTYYYRWKLYRSHLRELGSQGLTVTEFLPDVSWARHPYEDLNDSSSFHILEGRWLRNPAYVGALVDHLYAGAGNDRHFSESIAAAVLGWTQATGNIAPAVAHLDSMQYAYNLWDDHFDQKRGLYWIEPLLDATEYTIASIDASGAGFSDTTDPAKSGFNGGFSFRPSINSYQYGNAQAIATLATLSGQPKLAADFHRRADKLRFAMLQQLWNPALRHFTDIYERSTPTVKAGDFIRGRELVGLTPWQFGVVPVAGDASSPDYASGWAHVLSANELGGEAGLRTVEPTYARYMTQYRFDKATGLPECQWNGPSWPFQTSEVLTGMANLLNDYAPSGVTETDYVRLLRQYTAQHQLPSGKFDLEEDYDPKSGAPIVGLPRSHHYNHSTYNDLIVTGLIGLRPRSDDLLVIHPLLPGPDSSSPRIRSFSLDRLVYHGHELRIVYDLDGTRYHVGTGLSVFVDGKERLRGDGRTSAKFRLPPGAKSQPAPLKTDLAVNVFASAPSPFQTDLPIATASSTATDSRLYEPLDGRLWFFPEILHGWSPDPAVQGDSWYEVDLRKDHAIGSVDLAFMADEKTYAQPRSVQLQVSDGNAWRNIATPQPPLAGGMMNLQFPPVVSQRIRIVLSPSAGGLGERLIAFRVY